MTKPQMIGDPFRTFVYRRNTRGRGPERTWSALFRCECGTEFVTTLRNVISGKTKSCGCYVAKMTSRTHRTHGMSRSKTYKSWLKMIERCYSKKNNRYYAYGARGIAVCERWHLFENFLSDMGPRPEGTSLDRIDANKHYEPCNCRWATRQEQARNKRNSIYITIGDETASLADWSDRSGIKYATILRRLKAGWEAKKAVFDPVFSSDRWPCMESTNGAIHTRR
jgi:hypothetical protein